jgi:transcription initiation factor TFIIB
MYIACRETGASRTLADISTIVDARQKAISRSHRTLVNKLDINVPPMDLVKCIATVANKANINERTKRMAIHAMRDLTK